MAFPSGVTFGVSNHAGAYIKKTTKTKKVDEKDLLTSAGEIGVTHPYKTRTEFKVEGGGTTTVDTGVGASGLTGLTGGVTVINQVEETHDQEDFNMFNYGGRHLPFSVAG